LGYFHIKYVIFTSETETNKDGIMRWNLEISRRNKKRDVVNQKTKKEREKEKKKD